MFQCLPSPLATSSLPPPPPLLRTMAILHPVHGVVLAPPPPPPPPQIFAAIPQVLLALFIFSFRPFGCRLLSDGKGKEDRSRKCADRQRGRRPTQTCLLYSEHGRCQFSRERGTCNRAGAFATFIPFPFSMPRGQAFFRLSSYLSAQRYSMNSSFLP